MRHAGVVDGACFCAVLCCADVLSAGSEVLMDTLLVDEFESVRLQTLGMLAQCENTTVSFIAFAGFNACFLGAAATTAERATYVVGAEELGDGPHNGERLFGEKAGRGLFFFRL
jgi:hypothetical protein